MSSRHPTHFPSHAPSPPIHHRRLVVVVVVVVVVVDVGRGVKIGCRRRPIVDGWAVPADLGVRYSEKASKAINQQPKIGTGGDVMMI